jgi:heme/copper-type cytochrome/quinol oxidase subunit 2
MHHLVFVVVVLVFLFVSLWLSVIAGRRYGQNQMAKHNESKLEVVIVAEGAVFTLLALLVAFAFSGAYERFENRKLHILNETSTINTAYKRIDLIAPAAQPPLREIFKEYVDSRIQFYKDAGKLRLFSNDVALSKTLEDKVWQQTLIACKATNDASDAVTQLLVPAVNDMFDEGNSGMELTRIHPPGAIFMLLIGLSLLSGFLAGYSTAESKAKNPLHILCYVFITAFTIFIIVNLEFPRMGFIRIDSFDHVIVDERNHMN